MPAPKRQRIIAAMLAVVGERGYEGTSPSGVCERAGLPAEAFAEEFRTPAECFALAYESGVAEVETRLREAAPTTAAWQVRLRAGLTVLLEICEREPALARALLVEVHAAGEPALTLRAETMRRAAAFLSRGAEAGEARPSALTPEATAAGIHAVLHARLASGEHGYRVLLGELMYVAVLPYCGSEAAAAAMNSIF